MSEAQVAPSVVSVQQWNFAEQKMLLKLTATSKKPCWAGRMSATSNRTATSVLSAHTTVRSRGVAVAVGFSKSSGVPVTPPAAPEAKLPAPLTGAAKTPTTQTRTVLGLALASQVPT